MSGTEFAHLFLKRHANVITPRMCQNIKRARAAPDQIKQYFQNLEKSLEGVPITSIINYDETNLRN